MDPGLNPDLNSDLLDPDPYKKNTGTITDFNTGFLHSYLIYFDSDPI